MKKSNLVKSLTRVINNSKGLLILCLSIAIFGVNEAWGSYRATLTLNANPSTGGKVIWTKDNKGATCTNNTYSNYQSKSGLSTSGSFDFYLYYSTNNNYSFKGWSTDSNANTGTAGNPLKLNLKGSTSSETLGTGGEKYTYYAIFARMTADISSKDFGNVNVGQSSSATTITVTHAHASKITAALSGTNSGDFSLSNTTIVDNSVSESTATFTVTFRPTCNGARTATLTLSSTNGLSNVTISLSGTGVLNSQSLSWNNESAIELNMLKGTTQNISATATSGLAVSYSSSNSGVLSVDASGKLTAKSVGEATITAAQSGDCTYSAAIPISKTFNVKSKDTPIFSPNWSSTDIKVGDKVTLGVQYVSGGLSGDFKAKDYDSNILKVTRDGNTITIEALNAGSSDVTLTQTETSAIFAASKTYSFSISKIANTLAVANASPTMYVGDNLVDKISTNSDATINVSSNDETVAHYDLGSQTIIAQNTNNQSFNSKEVTITISQAATYKYTAAEKTITVTVNKWDNNIFINGSKDSYATSIYMDAQQSISLTATNTDYSGSPITADQTAGSTIAVMNDEQTQVTSNHNLGTATWTISQPENYKYRAANATLTVNVVQQAEATDCYVKTDLNSDHEFSKEWSMIWDDENAAQTLTFRAKCQLGWTYGLYVCQYINGSWSEAKEGTTNTTYISYDDLSTSYQSFEITLNTQAKGVKFVKRGTLDRSVRDIRVTRKTYLNADNVNITETASQNPIHPNETGVGILTINHSLANGDNLKVKWDNEKFSIDGKTSAEGVDLGDLGCSTGISNLPISYTSKVVGTDIANVVIYNNVYRAIATISGTTIKRDQNLQWNTDIMIVGQTVANAAQTTSIINGVVTYTSDDTDIIRVKADDNGQLTILEALQPGTTNITAFSAGNEEYNDAQSTKEITVTDKQIQYITWNQSLMGLKMGDADVSLNASAYQPDSLNCLTGGQRPIVYSSANTAVVEIVNGNKLKIKGIGVTTVTASQAGGTDGDGHDFIAVTAEKKVVVRDPNDPCETYIYEQTSEVTFDLGWNAAFHQTKTYEIDFNGKEPGFVNFDYKGKVHTVLIDYYAGTLSIEQYVNNQWVEVRNFGKPGTSEYTNTGDIALDRKATKMRVKAADGMGYMYFKDCRVTLARYLEGSNLSKFETKVGSPLTKTLNVNYSNISGPVTFTLSENSNFSLSKESIEGECGGYGSTTIDITYTPTQEAIGESATLTLADDIQKTQITLEGNAAVTPLHINWDIPSENSCYTLDEITLSATALTDLNIEVPNFVWFSLAQNSTTGNITGNTLSFTKAGIANVIAQTIGDPRYTPAQNIFKKWTVNLTPTTITTNPTISGDIISGTDIASLSLNGGAVQNTINNQPVEGTFAVTSGDLVNVGEQTLTVTFTPNNTDMYEGCTTTITANVVQREATAEEKGTPSAASITYGNAINTSVLSGNGSLAGTWTWVDEEANKATPNVGTVDNLNVIFTPNDGNVKQATNTVSLTVTAATPTLEWTIKAETAQVHETKTFTASSTNTDNTAAITYSIISGSECAIINETTGEVTMTKAGTITVQASQVATTNFNAPEPIETTCTISLAPTSITTKPTTDNIVSGTSLSEIVLTGGEAKNTINNQVVEGTFTVTDGDLVNVGQQTLTITFTPTDGDKYAGCTTTITATIVPRTPTNEEVGTPSATDIDYGNPVNTSVLTGNGTLDGTWSWIDNRKDDVLPVGTHDDLQVRFTPTDGNVRTVDAVVSLTITGEMENKFTGDGDWNEASNWTNGIPTGENPNVVISGNLTISNPISVGGLTIENTGKVNIVEDGDLTVNGTSAERDTYGNLFVRNGGNITINENAGVKVYDFVVESSIGTQNGTSVSGQVENSDKVIYTNGAYIDVNMDPKGKMDDTQWYGFTVPFPVDVQNGVARKEGETFHKCTYGSDYMIAEYDMNQRLNTGKGWKYIKTGQLQPGHFYYLTVNGNYNTYSFKAAETTFTIQTETAITTNGEGANANWNAVGNSTLMYAEVSGENLPAYVQTYVNGESRYQVVNTTDAQFVVGCPFFIQATKDATMVLKATEMQNILHYAPRSEETAQPICVRIAEEGQRFSDQMYITASEDALDTYELGRDLAKAGIGTKSAQLWVNAYKQSLCVNDAPLIDKKAYYDVTLYAPKAGSYEISLPRIPNNGTLYLTQNGMPMWNLNESAYSIECAKGNNSEYGLLFIESEPSGDGSMTNNPTLNDNNQWQKVLVNQHVYILQNGSVYDITGQKVK